MLKDKHILIGVTGGIAAYKIPLLVRDLNKAGADVRVIMTEAATEFVTAFTLATLSGNEVITGSFPTKPGSNVLTASTWHITLGRWADLMVIAPATANSCAKLAHGAADNAVTTLALALRCPLLISPAMDVDMWHHPSTANNIATLREMGFHLIPPDDGELASGLVGPGRLPETALLMKAIEDTINRAGKDFKGRRLLITAGPTQERIDPVRFIGNRSSGKMGFALATAASQRGADVTLISGRVSLRTPNHVRRIDVESAGEMHRAVMKHSMKKDAIIMAAAVADFTPVAPSNQKLKKETVGGTPLTVALRRTKDILSDLAKRDTGALHVGFALETENDLRNAKLKLKQKHLDMIVLNNAHEEGAGFDTDTNIVTILSRSGKIERLNKMSKYDVAHEILNRVSRRLK